LTKWKIVVLIFLMASLAIAGTFLIKNKKTTAPLLSQSQAQINQPLSQASDEGQKTSLSYYEQFFSGQISVCQLFPKEKIEGLTGKQFLEVKSGGNKTQRYTEYYCEYRQERLPYSVEHGTPPRAPKNISISFISGNLEGFKDVYKLSKERVEEDQNIPFSHHLVFNEEGKFLRLEIFLTPNLEMVINTWWSTLSQDEALKFVKDFALYFRDFVQQKTQTGHKDVSPPAKIEKEWPSGRAPLPQDEDIIRNFFSFFGTKDAYKAALMMKTTSTSERKAWTAQFAAFNYLYVLKIEKAEENNWTENKHIYKVILEVKMKPESARAPIPYYGYQNGQNTRWIILEKVGHLWKIVEITTGP